MPLRTQYLGFELPHPIMVGASPLIYDLDIVKQLEDAGAAAIVMHSLFEEQIVRDNVRGLRKSLDNSDYGPFPETKGLPLKPDRYLEHIIKLKEIVDIPIIASLNGIHLGSWVEYSKQMEEAGANALELNLNFLPRSNDDSSAEIENRAFQIVRNVKEGLNLPLAVKLSPSHSGLTRFIRKLEDAGSRGIVLFNEFFQPDIDIENLQYRSEIPFSDANALLLRTRWAATLHGRILSDISLSGGVRTAEDAVKAFMAGAQTVQVVSALIHYGPQHLQTLIQEFKDWMKSHHFENIEQLRGILSFMHCQDTESLARSAYIQTIQNWENPRATK